MITIHKKLIPATHGYHIAVLPKNAHIISVGAVAHQGMIPLFVKLDNEETIMSQVQVFVGLTNLLLPDDAANSVFVGSCQIDSLAAAHIFR